MASLVIFGVTDYARLAHHYFTTDSPHDVVAFTVDRAYRQAESFQGLPVVAFEDLLAHYPPEGNQLFVAVGYTQMNRASARKYQEARTLGYSLASYVSSRCTYLAQEPPGDNCFILEDVTVQPFARIGANVRLWSGATVCHDTSIGDHCFLAPNAVVAGQVEVASHCFIGANATVRNGLRVAERTLVGAGAALTRDSRPGEVYVPGRIKPLDKTSDQIQL